MKFKATPTSLTVAALAAVFLFLCLCTKMILLESYTRLEEDYLDENVRRALSTIRDDLAQLNSVAEDYSGWDDAYAFVADGNAEFIKGNLNDNIFPNLRLNLLAYVSVSGKIVYARVFDPALGAGTRLPRELLKHMSPSGPLLRHATTDSVMTGILLLPEGALLVASKPVLTSEYKGPIKGALILGRYLNAAETKRLADISGLSLTLSRFDDTDSAPEILDVRPLLSRETPVRIRRIDARTISGFALLSDIFGQPALIARVDMQRRIYSQGVKTGAYFIIWIMGGCALFVLVSRFFYAKLAASRRERGELAYMANHDPLTGLPNRVLFLDRLRQSLAKTEQSGKVLAVMFVDLDQFKLINDTLGHHVGDQLLKEVAGRLKGGVRNTDTVSRLGGDEFTLLIDDIARLDDAVLVAEKVYSVFDRAFSLEGSEMIVTPSIGIALYPADGDTAEVLLRNADLAMYHAKEKGRNNYQFFTEVLNTRMSERLSIQTGLRHALERNEFVLHYQPRVDLILGRVVGVEALIRWQHPQQGLMSPARFIPLAEESGLIVRMGEWVLRTACLQNKAWQNAGLPGLKVSVNVSARQFLQGGLAATIREMLAETGLGPEFLELEVTESIIMVNPEEAILTLGELKGMGVSIAIDDFGTGYSSLAQLKSLPIDVIKIDRNFVRGIAVDRCDETLVSTIISLARTLGLGVVAEGVETEAQLDFLRERGCREVQGFYLGRPLPPESLNTLLLPGKAAAIGNWGEAFAAVTP